MHIHGDLDPVEVDPHNDQLDNEATEELELWIRDPVACVHELIGNPRSKGDLAYTPEKVYADCHG